MRRFKPAWPLIALIGVTAVWGWTFVVVRDAVQAFPVLPFLALRFGLAALVLSPALARRGTGFNAGLLPGAVLAAGYLAQTTGLRYTTASQAGLLTGLFVVLTPAITFIVWRSRPPSSTAAAVAAALLGTALLVGDASGGMGSHIVLGDSLEVVTAICFSVHIVLLARFAPGRDAPRMALGQMTAAAVLFAAGALGAGGFRQPDAPVWFAVALTGAVASAAAFWIQTYVQQLVSPTRTALILTSEPAFATIFGFLLAGDRFGLLQALGAALILAAIVFHEASSLYPSAFLSAGS